MRTRSEQISAARGAAGEQGEHVTRLGELAQHDHAHLGGPRPKLGRDPQTLGVSGRWHTQVRDDDGGGHRRDGVQQCSAILTRRDDVQTGEAPEHFAERLAHEERVVSDRDADRIELSRCAVDGFHLPTLSNPVTGWNSQRTGVRRCSRELVSEAATRLPRKTPTARRRSVAHVSVPSARRLQPLALITTVPLVAMALVLASDSEHLRWPEVTGLYQAYLIAASVLVGVVWWRRRPASRFGPLLVIFGLIATPVSWGDTSSPTLHTLGSVAEAPFIAVNFYICLAYPVGRLSTTLERLLIWTWSLVLAAAYSIALLFTPVVNPSGALMQCVGGCPANPFQVEDAPDLASAANWVLVGTALAVATAIFVVYLARLRTASRPRQRALIAVAASSLLLLPAFSRSTSPGQF